MPDIIQFDPKSTASKKPAPAAKPCTMPVPLGAMIKPPPAMALALALTTGAASSDAEPVIAIERLVYLIVQAARRIGHRPSRLRPMLAAELDRHCRRGDPTARMLQQWIDRDTPFDRGLGEPTSDPSPLLGREG